MVESCAVFLVAALHRTAVGRNATEAGGHPRHRLWIEREEVIPAVMLDLGAAIGDTARRGQTWGDFAWVNGVVEDRRAEEDGVGGAAGVVAGRLFGV
jgi:hypothetical protein